MISSALTENQSYLETGASTYNYAVLPSEETHEEIEDLSNSETGQGVSLRAAPPGGTPIGGVPLESPSIMLLAIPFILYLIIKKGRRINRIQ